MIVGLVDSLNDCHFAIWVADDVDVELVKRCAVAGLDAWYAAAAGPGEEIEDSDYFTAEEIESFYYLGYAEPTSMLLDRYYIKNTILPLEFDEEEIAIADDVAVY